MGKFEKVVIKVATNSAVDLEDYKRVRISALASNPEAFGEPLQARLDMSDDEWIVEIERDKVVLGYANGELAGMTKVSVKEGICWLKGVWVAPKFRGQGFSDILVASSAATAILEGQDEMWLWVSRSNTNAIALYERNDFVAREDLTAPEHPTWVVMVKRLKAA